MTEPFSLLFRGAPYSYKKRGKRALKEWLETLTPEERKVVDTWIFQEQEKPPVFHETENPGEV